MATGYQQQCGGADCITCCPVETVCDCNLIECVINFYRYALNMNAYQYTGNTVDEVAKQGLCLIGFAVVASYERPVIDGTAHMDSGRTLTQSLIDTWGVDSSEIQACFQEIERVFSPYWMMYKESCLCDEDNDMRVACELLDGVMTTIHTFGRIGLTGNPPYTLKEWAEGGICGVCYTDCDGDNFIADKQAIPPPV